MSSLIGGLVVLPYRDRTLTVRISVLQSEAAINAPSRFMLQKAEKLT